MGNPSNGPPDASRLGPVLALGATCMACAAVMLLEATLVAAWTLSLVLTLVVVAIAVARLITFIGVSLLMPRPEPASNEAEARVMAI